MKSTIDLCSECAQAAGVDAPHPPLSPGALRLDGCDSCREQHKRAVRYATGEVVAALVRLLRGSSE